MNSTPSFDSLYDRLVEGEEKLALIGLGYVGMPIAVEFAKHIRVIGLNHNENRIQQYKSGVDPTHEVGDKAISKTTVDFTSDETRLREAKFLIVTMLTPINTDHTPDLEPVENASRIVGRNLHQALSWSMNQRYILATLKMSAFLFWRRNLDSSAVLISR